MEIDQKSPEYVKIHVFGRGLDLIRQYQRIKKFKLHAYPGLYNDSTLVRVFDLERQWQQQLLPGIQFQSVTPDTLHFPYRKLYGRQIAITADLDLRFAREYGQTGDLRYLPDSVRVYSFTPDIKFPEKLWLESYKTGLLKKNLRLKLAIRPPADTRLFIRKKQVVVEIPVNRITEGEFNLPIQLRNAPAGIRLVPAWAEVRFETGLHHYKNVKAEDFEITSHWSQRTSSGHLTLKVSCKNPDVLRYYVYPASIDYILP